VISETNHVEGAVSQAALVSELMTALEGKDI
jgi:hypothetical protein